MKGQGANNAYSALGNMAGVDRQMQDLRDENRKLKQEAALYILGRTSELRQMVEEYLEDAQ